MGQTMSNDFHGYTTFNHQHLDIISDALVPQHIRMTYPNFYRFVQIYLDKVSTKGEGMEFIHNMLAYANVDETNGVFLDIFARNYLKEIDYLPQVNRRILVKWIRQWYEATGTEQSIRFLFRVLFNEDVTIYYPSTDMLRVSDGKWMKERIIRIKRTPDHPVSLYQDMLGTEIRGLTSGAVGLVERAVINDHYSDHDESDVTPRILQHTIDLYVSDFSYEHPLSGLLQKERIECRHLNDDDVWVDEIDYLASELRVNETSKTGQFYQIGDRVTVQHPLGYEAFAVIQTVTSGSFESISVVDGGRGYLKGDVVSLEDGHGYGCYAVVTRVDASGSILSLKLGSGGEGYVTKPRYVWRTEAGIGAILNPKSKGIGSIATVQVIDPGYNYRDVEWDDVRKCFQPILSIDGCYNAPVPFKGYRGDLTWTGGNKQGGGWYPENAPVGGQFKSFLTVGHQTAGTPSSKAYTSLSDADRALFDETIEKRKNYIFPILFEKVALKSAGRGDTIVSFYRAPNNQTPLIGRNDMVYAVQGGVLYKGRVRRVDNTRGLMAVEMDTAASMFPRGAEIYTLDVDGNIKSNGNMVLSSTRASLSLVTGPIANIPAYYDGRDGWVDSEKRIQDSYFYQVFSYVVKTKHRKSEWERAVNDATHPSGLIVFGMKDIQHRYGHSYGGDRVVNDGYHPAFVTIK